MECDITKKSVDICTTAYENYSEEKIDIDIIIPDYMPSAARVMRCDVTPSVTSAAVNDGRLEFDGMCRVNIIYIDENDSKLCSISESVSFDQSQPLKEQFEGNYRVIEKLRTSNINCRLQNPRRIGVKALVGIAAKVMGNKQKEIISSVEGCDIETQFDRIDVCAFVSSGESDIRINGETTAPDDPEDVLKSDGCVFVTDRKVLNDKVLIKGEAVVNVLYTADGLKSVSLSIPFSEVIDCIGAEENSKSAVDCDITGIRVSLNGNRAVSVEADVKACASVYKNDVIELLDDAYSKSGELETESGLLNVESLADDITFSETVKGSVSVDQSDLRIAEIFIEPVIRNISPAEGSLEIEGDISLAICAETEDGYSFIDRTVPFGISESIDSYGADLRCEASVCAKSVSFSMPDDNTVEVRVEADFELLVFSRRSFKYLDSLSFRENCERCDFGSRFIVYYADKDETLWDIAKKFKTSVKLLIRDNPEAEKTNGHERMLLISGN